MESKATELLTILKNANASIENKVTCLTAIKSDIKQRNVPENAIVPIFEALRLAITAQHSSLSAAGFSTLSHLLKRLFIQEHHHAIATQARHLYPSLVERLGDHKERARSHAAQAFTDLWPAAPAEVEHHVLEGALVGKNPRAKEMSMLWLSNMTKEHNLLFRAYVPSLVACLEDADSGVRETAKMTVIELFQNAPSRAKSDLKKQLSLQNVRKSIATIILASLGLTSADHDVSSSRSDIRRPVSSFSNHRSDPPRPNSVLSARSQGTVELGKDGTRLQFPSDDLAPGPAPELEGSRQRPGTSKGEPGLTATLSHSASLDSLAASAAEIGDGERMEPLDVISNREIDEMVRGMLPHFEGRETEQNWLARDKAILTLRRLTRGNAPHAFLQHYLTAIKTLLDGILKVANSLRTTPSTTACLLIQDIARTCGPGIDHMVEILLQNFIKLCAGMKKISAQNGNATVDVIIGNVSYTARILQHLWFACQDKNVQPRLYATGWLKTLINKHTRHRSLIEHSGGPELMDKCIKRGLSDANPGVRDGMRGTFWTFYGAWPERATEILSALDNKSKTLLEKDPANPNIGSASGEQSRSALSNRTSTTPGRPTLKETIASQKKRLAATNNLPPRPESAQSSFTDAKAARPTTHKTPATKSSTVRTVPTGTHFSSLSSAPLRPAGKTRRPELARPATADPYADRRAPSAASASRRKPLSPKNSPPKSRPRLGATPGPKPPSASRPKPGPDTDTTTASTAKNKARRLDLSTLQSSDARSMANRLRSASNDLPKPPFDVEEDLSKPITLTPNGADLISGVEPRILPETVSVSYRDAVIVPEPLVGLLPSDNPSTPILRPRLDSDGSVSRLPVSVRTHSKTSSNESKVTSPSLFSPDGARSRNRSDDRSYPSQTTSPVAHRFPPGSEELPTADHLKVYEDPEPLSSVLAGSPRPIGHRSPDIGLSAPKISVLEELPMDDPTSLGRRDNKQISRPERTPRFDQAWISGGENTHRRWGKVESMEKKRSISPRSKDPVKAREMIEKGIIRIKARALDVHGYRKLQGLIKYHEAIFADEAKYDEMLLALVEALETPSDERRATLGRPLDLKTQILVTIRIMFSLNTLYFSIFHPRVMTALLNARQQYELTNHIVSGLEETAEDIVAACQPPDVIDAVLDLIETEEKHDEGYRAITMGIYVLTGLLRRLNKNRVYLSQPEIERLGKFANRSLAEPQPDIRRAITEFCVELHEMVNDDKLFWRMVDSPMGDHRNLLTYFIVKKSHQPAQL